MILLWLKFHYCNGQYHYFISLQKVNNTLAQKVLQKINPSSSANVSKFTFQGFLAIQQSSRQFLRGTDKLKKYEISLMLVIRLKRLLQPDSKDGRNNVC